MGLTQVKTSGLADDAVTGAKIADDTVAEANMANDAISLTELKAGTDGQIITYDASGNPTAVGPGTDGQVLTSTGAGSPPAFETLSIPAGVGGATGVDFNDGVKIRSGTDNDLEIYHHAGDSYIRNNGGYLSFGCTNNADIQIVTNNTERMRVNTDGIVTTPNQPSFRAQRSGTSWNHSSGTLAWDNQIFDTNNDYDDSNYTFTCPVDGVYLFICSVMQEHGGTGGNMTFKKNGSTFNTTQWTAAGGTSDWDGYDMVAIINCSASDAILSNHGSNSNFHGGNYAHFSGYLIG